MISDNRQVFYCEDGDYRVYCYTCDNLCIERYFKNHLKLQTHMKIICKRKKLKK